MHPAGDDVFGTSRHHVAGVRMGPFGRPDQSLGALGLHFQVVMREMGAATDFNVVQLGNPHQHPMQRRQRGALRVHQCEMAAWLVTLDVEIPDVE